MIIGGLLLAAILGGLLVFGGWAVLSQKQVTLDVDGQILTLYTRQPTVNALLEEIELVLLPQDAVEPPLETRLSNHMRVEVRRAVPVLVQADGQAVEVLTRERVPARILAQAGVTPGRYDRVLLDGRSADPATPLDGPLPAVITLVRAVPMTVDVDGETLHVYTTAATVGQTLDEMGVTIVAADEVVPPLDTPPTPDLHVVVRRSVPLTVVVDDSEYSARTLARTVGQALADAGFVLVGEDYTLPPLEAPLPPDGRIEIVRVTEEVLTERTEIPYETIYRPDSSLELDERRVLQAGAPGVLEQRTRIRYENGVAVSRVEEPPRVLQPPVDEVIAYGTRIVVRTLQTPDGPLEYWRVVRMLATSYTPATSSKPPDAPNYGIASTGIRVERGIVAVDPEVIPYFTRVYVPGYGVGLAADTGGAVNGRRIDLGYSDDDLELWYSWVDVYLLTPVPPAEDILYLLP
ncbi:MAG: 3D domain-containing protein [Anaerolineae bacterium]